MSLELVGENNILPVEMIQTGMFYKSMKQSYIGDRVNCLLRSNLKKFGKLVNRGGVLVPEGHGQKYHNDEFSFKPDIDLSMNYTRAAAHTWDVNISKLDKNCVKLDKKYFRRGSSMRLADLQKLFKSNHSYCTRRNSLRNFA